MFAQDGNCVLMLFCTTVSILYVLKSSMAFSIHCNGLMSLTSGTMSLRGIEVSLDTACSSVTRQHRWYMSDGSVSVCTDVVVCIVQQRVQLVRMQGKSVEKGTTEIG